MNIGTQKHIVQQCIAEFFGTGLIVLFSTGAIATTKLTTFYLNHWQISCIGGLAVAISIYFSSSVSGAHLNPAITIFLWLSSQFHRKKVLPYIFSQILGSFFFSLFVYFLYRNVLIFFEQKYNIIRGTQNSLNIASIFCTFPRKDTSFIYNLFMEIINTAIFMMALMSLNNKKNYILKRSIIIPLLIGILITLMAISIGTINNITLNPAKDLGSRFFLSTVGWGLLSFTGGKNIPYFLIPMIGPILGAQIGGWIYGYIKK